MRKAINVLVKRGQQVLLVKKNSTWILPGGKPESRESDLECLSREIIEELPGVRIQIGEYLGSIIGNSPHKGDKLIANVYSGKLEGELVKPGAEISDVKFIKDFWRYNLSQITRRAVYFLTGGYS